MSDLFLRLRPRLPTLLLALLIIAYILYFSWYTINRHNTLNSYAADLSLIDQPMWNTARGPGGLMESTWGDRQQPRLAEHFEPILIPLAYLFFIWDDVRILLIVQSVALGLGALPVFWIARHQLKRNDRPDFEQPSQPVPAGWAGLVFSAVYLLSPHLQAANIADFHADPLVVTPLLFAFWYATQSRWAWMWLWSLIAMMTKENLPTLTAMLGLLLVIDAYRTKSSVFNYHPPQTVPRTQLLHGLTLSLVSTAWFLIATFVIVSPLAQQYFGTTGPIYFASRFDGSPATLGALLQEPARWRYLLGLIASFGFLPLLAPDLLLLGLPVFIANFLSNFPGQYSGEQHYSAPLTAVLVLAAIFGTRRLISAISLREMNGQHSRVTALIFSLLWLSGWSLAYHGLHGWTPFSIRTEWYQLSSTAEQLPGLAGQIPADARVSSSPAVHPHLAHRRINYVFPTVKDAEYLLVDITDISGAHPYDVHATLQDMLNEDWQLLQANQGLILAKKGAAPPAAPPCSDLLPLPCRFYEFAHSNQPPQFAASVAFGDGQLHLVGYDVLDDPDDGITFRFYWQATGALPEDLRLWPLIYSEAGQILSDSSQVPMIAPVWYPPQTWEANRLIVTETLPLQLPDRFHLGLATGLTAASFRDPTLRLPVSGSSSTDGRWTQLASFKRQGPYLIHLSPQPTLQPFSPVSARFGPAIALTGYRLDENTFRPEAAMPLVLQWTTDQPPPADYTVFIHLLGPDGQLVSQSDSYPTWLTARPTSRWPLRQPILDSHSLKLPDQLPPGTYSLVMGLYDAQTGERLPLPDGHTAYQLTELQLE